MRSRCCCVVDIDHSGRKEAQRCLLGDYQKPTQRELHYLEIIILEFA